MSNPNQGMKTFLITLLIVSLTPIGFAQSGPGKSLRAAAAGSANVGTGTDYAVVPFGSGEQLKMIYDRRLRPQAVYFNDKVYLVYNGGAAAGPADNDKTYPFATSCDPATGQISPLKSSVGVAQPCLCRGFVLFSRRRRACQAEHRAHSRR